MDRRLGQLALSNAVRAGNLKKCRRLLGIHSVHLVMMSTFSETSLLQQVIDRDQRDFLALFLGCEPKIDLEMRHKNGFTALLEALLASKFRCYEMLVAAGADPFPQTTDARIFLLCSVAAGDVAAVERVLAAHKSVTTCPETCLIVLAAAAGLGRTAVLQRLLSQPAFACCVNMPTAVRMRLYLRDWTAVMRAVEGGHVECFDVLMDAGADLVVPPKAEGSLVHIAAKNGHPGMLRRLLALPQLACYLTKPDKARELEGFALRSCFLVIWSILFRTASCHTLGQCKAGMWSVWRCFDLQALNSEHHSSRNLEHPCIWLPKKDE
eukprot:m.290174 g.290174  ORF g.290174 m.290174 type:complete len:323 (+) comp55072_c0_seq3:83-1051(+)